MTGGKKVGPGRSSKKSRRNVVKLSFDSWLEEGKYIAVKKCLCKLESS